MKLKTLKVTAKETGYANVEDDDFYFEQFDFEAHELPTGECVVVGSMNADEWYASRDEIEANGAAFVVGVEETGETAEWTQEEIRKSVYRSRSEYGLDAIPESLRYYALATLSLIKTEKGSYYLQGNHDPDVDDFSIFDWDGQDVELSNGEFEIVALPGIGKGILYDQKDDDTFWSAQAQIVAAAEKAGIGVPDYAEN